MRKTKLVIAFLILFISVGIAAVTTSVLISGSTQLASNPSDFLVYFSNVLVNGEQDLSLVQSKNSLYFSNVLNEVGDSYVISYDVTNASKNYDADISISCTQGNEYISVVNEFDSTSYLTATSTRSGVLTISLKKTYAGEYELVHDVSCIIDSEAVERTSQGSGTIPLPLSKYYVGREISIGDEKFNIIGETDDTVTMLARYNIDVDTNKQTQTHMFSVFSEIDGWEYTPGPKEIDVQTWGTDVKTVLNSYVSYLNSQYDVSAVGDFITLLDLSKIGCTVPNDYSEVEGWTCEDSPYIEWLANGQYWWTKSAGSSYSGYVWFVEPSGSLWCYFYYEQYGVRPVITIDKTTADELIIKGNYRTYEIGEVITIDTESFNVISDNGDTVTMFAKERLSTDYLQCVDGVSESEDVTFSYETGWEYTPGPKEINIRDYSSDVATYLDNYQANLRTMTGDDTLTTDLITLTQLGELGCIISEDYTPTGSEECLSSPYASWLVNNEHWIWTKSARSNDPEMVWIMSYDGYLAQDVSGEWFTGDYYYGNALYDYNGVRPVVTISKEYLLE